MASDRDAVLATARAFLESEFTDERLLVADLAERLRVGRAVPRTYEWGDFHVDIRRLSLVHVAEQTAICDCDARYREELVEGDRLLLGVIRYSIRGRITLVKEGSDWLIADYPKHGLPVRSTFRVYRDLAFPSGDFVVTPRMLHYFPGQTSLVLGLANNGRSKARLRHAYLRARSRVLLMRSVNGFLRGHGHVAAGETGLFDIGWRVSPKRVPIPLEVEVVVASALAEPLHIAFKLPGIQSHSA